MGGSLVNMLRSLSQNSSLILPLVWAYSLKIEALEGGWYSVTIVGSYQNKHICTVRNPDSTQTALREEEITEELVDRIRKILTWNIIDWDNELVVNAFLRAIQ